MAQIIPSITSLPIDSLAAPSAEDIQDRLPSICVDYLSHDWSEEDVWASWRSMTRHKHEIANGVRLENASWRTWQKQRNNLKTISPETLNWLKDSDVTWLYGPLHTAAVEPVRPMKVATTDERLGIDRPTLKGTRTPSKPILKHRTLSEMLTIPNPSSPILEAVRADDSSSESDGEGGRSNRPVLMQTKSDTNIANSRTAGVKVYSLPKPTQSGDATPDAAAPMTSPTDSTGKEKRHISFNTFVEQCQAISDSDLPVQQEESDDDMLEMRSNSSRSSRSSRGSRPSLSRHSSSGSTQGSEHLTIAMIAPTMLKFNGTHPAANAPAFVYAPPPEYRSPRESPVASTSPAASSQFDFPSPNVQTKEHWGSDNDEYSSVGFDYFGGPDHSSHSSAPAHVGSSYGRPSAPVVNQAPAQPKWRQQQTSSNSSSLPSTNSSSSASLVTSPPVPSRGILKVRPPGATPPEPSSPPQSSYFNYNPSPATGIGGMRSSYEYPSVLETQGPGSGSPLVSPATQATQERGRSAQRQHSSSAAYDRSASRTSASSTSMSPGAVRTPPTDVPRKNPTSPGHVQSPPIPSHANIQPTPPAVQASLGEVALGAKSSEEDMTKHEMDVDEPYQPDRSNTPTPHSSPQISLRPLKDTSPASLPHTSSRPAITAASSTLSTSTPTPTSATVQTPRTSTYPATSSLQPSSSRSPKQTAAPLSPELPKADPPISVSPPNRPVRLNSGGPSGGGKATTAHVGTNAQPTLSQPPTEYSPPLFDGPASSTYTDELGEDEDGSSIIGRAANIASSARELLGGWWYGDHPDGPQQSLGQASDEVEGLSSQSGAGGLQRKWSGRKHKRGTSLG